MQMSNENHQPFPDYAVNQLFKEFQATKGDDAYATLFIQTES